MASSAPSPSLRRTVDLVVLCFGAGLVAQVRMLRDAALPAVADWCTRQGVQLRVHTWWPEDTAERDDESDDSTEAQYGRLRPLVEDEHVFVLAIIGPDVANADLALLTEVHQARPEPRYSRVLYMFCPNSNDDYEDLHPSVPRLWRGALWYARRDFTTHYFENALRTLLTTDMALDLRSSGLVIGAMRRRPRVIDENVQFTVYRPNAVQPELWYPLLAFAHLAERRPGAPLSQPSPLEQVQALAEQAGVGAYAAPRADARGGVPREGQLTFVPFVEGIDFNPRSQTFEWQEDVHQQNFRLRAWPATQGRVLRGRLTVYLGAFILADIALAFRVSTAAEPPPTPTVRSVNLITTDLAPDSRMTPVTAVPYKKVFPSYSHKDLAIVHQAEAYGEALGHVYLRDRLALRSGEQWEERLLELIDEADIFQLFWSSNSMTSEYVRREWEHALALSRPAFIRPTYWEVPMPRSADPPLPPDTLRKLHFYGFSDDYGRMRGDSYVEEATASSRHASSGQSAPKQLPMAFPPSAAPEESYVPAASSRLPQVPYRRRTSSRLIVYALIAAAVVALLIINVLGS
jgi:hypothetical protein